MEKLIVFIERMKKIGIEMEISSNVPWVYLEKVCGKRVEEKRYSDHAYTIGFTGVRKGQTFKFLDLGEMFDIIRKYIKK